MDPKTINKQGEGSSLSDASTSTRATSSPGRTRRVSMKLKKGLKEGLKEVKEFLSPHHHHHHHHDHDSEHDGGEQGHGHGGRRRKSGPNESRRGPLAPVLDHLEKSHSVPIHLHISRAGSFSISRKASSSSYSCSDLAPDDSKVLADPQPQPQPEQPVEQQEPPQLAPSQPEMEVPEPFVAPPSPQHDDNGDDDGEQTPNPFLVDDPEDPVSDPGSPPAAPAPVLPLDPELLAPELPEVPPAETVVLTPAPQTELPLPPEPTTPAVDKPVPALPVASDTESEPEVPAVHLPQLVLPTMFLPIPNTDPLTTLLTKYISNPERRPQRDLTGEWNRTDFHTLVMTNSWRALARMARDRIVQADPEDLSLVLNLWSLRLSSLARLRLFNQASAEATNLFGALAGIAPPSAHAHVLEHLLPFELDVIHARVRYWAGDAHGYADALGALLRRCRRRARGARVDADRHMWSERGARVGLIAASHFIEIKDFAAAAALLEPLATQQHEQSPTTPTPTPTPTSNSNSGDLRSALGRVYLQAGQLDKAEAHFAAVAADRGVPEPTKALNAAFVASARGDWDGAGELLRALVAQDDVNYAAINNLAVALLGQGKLKEGIQVLEAAMEASPSTLAMAEPFLFNLSTLYELRSSIAADKKRELLVEVAKWSGDGLRTTCLKMPTN
ncbi:hypothetical protein BC826DRAFT_1031882, partial [Russula brevipes]